MENNLSQLSKDELYHRIQSYRGNDWVNSPEYAELERRLKEFPLEQLQKEGYWIPNWRDPVVIESNKKSKKKEEISDEE